MYAATENTDARRSKKPRRDEAETCDCDSGGYNKSMCVECPIADNPRCSNNWITRGPRAWRRVKRGDAGRVGCGLFADELIRAGEYILEYVGEIIDLGEFNMRKHDARRRGEAHVYFVTVGDGVWIDAYDPALSNLARFINHSCDPNSEMRKLSVRGEERVGVFAVKDIHRGEQITFSYGRVCLGKECLCGAIECRGTM